MRARAFLLALLSQACSATSPPTLTSATVPATSTRPDLAVYQRANELDRAGRCDEATRAYVAYANAVSATDPRSAAMAIHYAALCRKHFDADPTRSAVVTDVVSGRDEAAVDLAERKIRDGDTDPWLEYNLGVALADVGRTNDAVAAFSRAELRFIGDPWARSIAVYGRARALHDAYRCDEAKRAYEEYASLVRASDPKSAADALAVASHCTPGSGVRRR